MIFGEFSGDAAEGVVLAHTMKVGGTTLKKGRVLGAAERGLLRRAGITTVLGARLDDDDVGEDAAAAAIAALLVGAGTHVEAHAARAGRCNLHASEAGVFRVDAARIDALNLVDEAVTVGTLAPLTPVRKGQVVATVKLIPFAAPRRLIDACRATAAGDAPLRVAAFRPHRAALIMSERAGMHERIFTATAEVTHERLAALGSRLELVLRCAHEQAAIGALLARALAAGCELLLVSGASVAKDRHDIAPAAVTAAGGVIEHFGMPVEPGNMLVLARIGGVPVIILPGCGRSRRTNGLDRVLQRLLSGIGVTRRDIMGMGVGGLIRSPREAEDDVEDAPSLGAAAADAPLRAAPPRDPPSRGAPPLAAPALRRSPDGADAAASSFLRTTPSAMLVAEQ
jgi:molybdenum cofactor cytidylyltransferase